MNKIHQHLYKTGRYIFSMPVHELIRFFTFIIVYSLQAIMNNNWCITRSEIIYFTVRGKENFGNQ
jgi:hypothetical protein